MSATGDVRVADENSPSHARLNVHLVSFDGICNLVGFRLPSFFLGSLDLFKPPPVLFHSLAEHFGSVR